MNRLLFTPPLLLITLFGTSQALAQSSLKGQGRAFTGAGVFSLTVDARGSRGTAAGSFRYDRKTNGALEELVVVAAADCLWTSIDGTRAVVSGRADVRSNPAGLATKEWFFIGIQDAGPAEKNRARAGFVSRVEGLEMCQAGSTSFPAMVDVGDFVITRDAGASVTGGGSAGGLTGTPVPGNPTAPPFDGALYLPFDGTASPGQIVTKPGATPPTFVPGKYGQAIYFNDSSAVAVPFELSPIDTPQITMTAWIKRSPGSSMGKIVSSAGTGHPVMQIYGGSVKRLRGSGGREAFNMSIDGFDIKTGQWTFIAVVLDYELKTIRLQVDDSEPQTFDRQRDGQPLRMEPNGWDVRAQSELVGPDGKKGYYVTIGASEFSSFGGVARGYAIDDVRIYTRALSEQAVAGLAGGSTTATPGSGESRFANIPVMGDPVRDFSPPEELAKRTEPVEPPTLPSGVDVLNDPAVTTESVTDAASSLPAALSPLVTDELAARANENRPPEIGSSGEEDGGLITKSPGEKQNAQMRAPNVSAVMDLQTLGITTQYENRGDEYYLATYKLRARRGADDRIVIFDYDDQVRPILAGKNWAEKGEVFSIPPNVGRLSFENLQPFEVYGFVAILMEANNNSDEERSYAFGFGEFQNEEGVAEVIASAFERAIPRNTTTPDYSDTTCENVRQVFNDNYLGIAAHFGDYKRSNSGLSKTIQDVLDEPLKRTGRDMFDGAIWRFYMNVPGGDVCTPNPETNNVFLPPGESMRFGTFGTQIIGEHTQYE